MKALVYKGPKAVSLDKVPDAEIEQPTDVLVEGTTTNICGSDLHMYEVLGHETLGIVREVGKAVYSLKVIGCGFCENCERGFTGFCLTASPGSVGAAYGFAGMGPESGKPRPSQIVSHELPLSQAPDAYQNFDARKSGLTKVVLKPAA